MQKHTNLTAALEAYSICGHADYSKESQMRIILLCVYFALIFIEDSGN